MCGQHDSDAIDLVLRRMAQSLSTLAQRKADCQRVQAQADAAVEAKDWLADRPDLQLPTFSNVAAPNSIEQAKQLLKDLDVRIRGHVAAFLAPKRLLRQDDAGDLQRLVTTSVSALKEHGEPAFWDALRPLDRYLCDDDVAQLRRTLAHLLGQATDFGDGELGTYMREHGRDRSVLPLIPSIKEAIEKAIDSYQIALDAEWREIVAQASSAGTNESEMLAVDVQHHRALEKWIAVRMARDEFVPKWRAAFVEEATRQSRAALERARRECQSVREECLQAYASRLRGSFLACDAAVTFAVSNATDVDCDQKRTEFVQEWCNQALPERLDDQQVRAVASVHEHTLVTARAGSGKTRTLIARAAFLVRHCHVQPGEILMLAFNRKAAEEMRNRLHLLGVDCPHVMTFHALAYAIVHPEEALLYDDPSEDVPRKAREFDRILREFLRDPARREAVRKLMLAHFRHDWSRIEGSGAAMSRDEGLAYRRSLEQEALDGTRVKSFGEKVIANFLFEHGIPYGYEWNRMWGDRNYRPDFTLKNAKIVIEYFGMQGTPEYDEQMHDKRAYWEKQNGWTLLEYTPDLLVAGDREAFERRLAEDLRRLGVPGRRLREEQIWKNIQDRVMTNLGRVLSTFIGRCRKALWTPEDLDARIRGHQVTDEIESGFIGLASEAYRFYLQRLASEGKEDFDGLMARSAELVEAGTTHFERKSGAGDLRSIRFVMIDEYQDFSPLFDRLLAAIRAQNPDVQVFAVGDDWQAINRFAGSDLKFVTGFQGRFEPSTELPISTNYRSAAKVVEAGNRIMQGLGTPAKPRPGPERGRVAVADMADFLPESPEVSLWRHDILTPAVRRLVAEPLKKGKKVALLARQGYLPFEIHGSSSPRESDLERLLRNIRRGMSQEQQRQLDASTAHSYKGKEADVVIVLDAVERRYPKIHPDWVFARIFGDSPDTIVEDERRLFYVACSRAIEELIILTESGRRSPFLDGLAGCHDSIDWQKLAPQCPSDGDWVLRVGNGEGMGIEPTKTRADMFKELKFSFSGGAWPHWWLPISKRHSKEVVCARIEAAKWVHGCDGLDIRLCDSSGAVVARWVLVDGVPAPVEDGPQGSKRS
ncbi:MAG: UvrD-helicase domain-containing protein [Phycisphaerales bacterium]